MSLNFKNIYNNFSSKDVNHVNFTVGLGLVILVISIFFGNFLSIKVNEISINAANNKTGNKCFDDCRKESGTKVCNEECGTDYVPGVPDAGNKNEDGSCAVPCGGPGLAFNFCLPAGSKKTCNQEAEDRGYLVPIGNVTCVKDTNGTWSPDTSATNYTVDGYTQALNQCTKQCSPDADVCGFGSGIYLCKKGHVGACTAGNGKTLSKIPSCFCGVIQVDTGSGHKSYKSDCGCEKEVNPTSTPIVTTTPTPTPTGTPTVTSTPTPTPTFTSTPYPSGTPNYCGGTCGSNSNCQSGLSCTGGFCRNPSCPNENDCNCKVTSTPTAPPVLGVTAPPQLPKTGGEVGITLSLFGVAALGVYIFRKFKLI